MIEARRSSSLSLPIRSVKVQLTRINKNIKRTCDQELSSPVTIKKLRVESTSSEGTSDHQLTPPTTPAPEVLFGVEDDQKDRDEDRALEAATFFDLPTPDVMKAFPQSGHQLKIKAEISTTSGSSSSLNTPQITVTSSGQISHPLATSEAMRGSTTYSNMPPFMDDEGEMNITGAMDSSLNTPNVDLGGNNPFIFNNPFNQQPLLSHQPVRSNFQLIATHTVVPVTQSLSIDVQEPNQIMYSTSCDPSPSDQALEYAPPPYQQQQQASYTEMQGQQRSHHNIQELPVTVAEHCRSPSFSAVPSPAPSNESSMASSSSPANQDQFSIENLPSRSSLGRKGSDASNCSVGSRARKTKKQQFTELVHRQQYLTQHNEQLRNQLKCYERACQKLKLMLLDKMKNAARMC